MNSKAKYLSYAALACVVLSTSLVQAQDAPLPPIRPAIERDTGATRMVVLSNDAQHAPVAISGSLTVGVHSYGQGYLTLKNVSAQPIVAFRGAWEVRRTQAEPARHHWDVGGPTLVFNGGLQPGEEISFPIPGPPSNAVENNQRVTDVVPLITGVVFYDKTIWGADGDELARKLTRDQKIFVSVAEQLRDASHKLAPREFSDRVLQRDFAAPNSTAFFPDIHTQMMLSHVVLDDKQLVRTDAAERLDRIIDRLKQF